ncbi:MAG: hypothetical protein KKH98_08760 [Spirochaetes bacterium]|nr:hypothetical protein [Spirochaetota bacterium]
MIVKGKNLLLITVVIFILFSAGDGFSACFGILGGGVSVPKDAKKTGIWIETDIKPSARFEEARIKSISILKFDAKYVKSVRGEIIDYIDLSNRFTDDILKRFYKSEKVDVALGEYEDKVIETDILEKKRGDLEIHGNTLQRSIEYKATPYKKIEAILGGRINKYDEGEDWDHAFIEITLKMTDTYSGAVYWITDMRGYTKDIVETIVKSVNEGKYTEPIVVKKSEKVEKKEEKKKDKEEEKKKK